jgi:riboflavin kinase/FMN adenylyltransferase
VGKFESIHAGHRLLIRETVRLGRLHGLPSVAVSFDPHPGRLLHDPAYQTLLTSEERAWVLKGLGLDLVAEYPFDAGFMNLSPEDFCALLKKDWQMRAVVLGEGYRFGRQRSGSEETLRRLPDVEAVVLKPSFSENKKISTSDIRALLEQGSVDEANRLLGYPFFIMGEVVHGRHLGQALGFPTANIIPPLDKFLPLDGVYASCLHIGGQIYNSVTNVGTKPTVNDKPEKTVETYIIGFDGDLYGEGIRVDFLRFIRPERRFDNVEMLRRQIAEDVGKAVVIYKK